MARFYTATEMPSASADASLPPAVHRSENERSRMPHSLNQPLPSNGLGPAQHSAMSVHVQQAVFNGTFLQPSTHAGPSLSHDSQFHPNFDVNGHTSAGVNAVQATRIAMSTDAMADHASVSQGPNMVFFEGQPLPSTHYHGPVNDHAMAGYCQHSSHALGYANGVWSDTDSTRHDNVQMFANGFANGHAMHFANGQEPHVTNGHAMHNANGHAVHVGNRHAMHIANGHRPHTAYGHAPHIANGQPHITNGQLHIANGRAPHNANGHGPHIANGHPGHPGETRIVVGDFHPPLPAHGIHHASAGPAPMTERAPASMPPIQGLSIEIVLENPNDPKRRLGKRRRTTADLDQQRKDNRVLKNFGGACLWCYRNKKKCGPENPCPPCEWYKRECVRDVNELCFLCSFGEFDGSSRHFHDESGLFETAMQLLRHLQNQIVDDAPGQRWVVTLRGQEPAKESVWTTDLASLSTWSGSPDELSHILSVSLQLAPEPRLMFIDRQWLEHPLFASAVTMCKSLAFILNLGRSRVFASPADLDKGRLVVLHLLVAQAQILCQRSAEFCTIFSDVLRRRESYDSFTTSKGSASSLPTNNPIWVAVGIYHRVVERLLEAEQEPVVSLVQDKLIPRLHEIIPLTWAAVKIIPSGLMTTREMTTERFDAQIAPLAEPEAMDIALCIEMKEEPSGDSTPQLQQSDPFLKTSWGVVDILIESSVTSTTSAEVSDSGSDGHVAIKSEESDSGAPVSTKTGVTAMEPEPSQSSTEADATNGTHASTEAAAGDQPEQELVFDGLPDISSFGDWDGTVCHALSEETSWMFSESDDSMFQSPLFGSQTGVNSGTLNYRDFTLYPQAST